MPITAADIAEAAGVSRATVSRILGDHAHRFSPQTRQRVEAAASRLGYRPNTSARAVRTGRFRTIGLLQADTEGPGRMAAELVDGILGSLAERGLHLLTSRLGPATGAALPASLGEHCLDGLLIAYTHAVPPGLHAALAKLALPMVWINAPADAAAIVPDDHGAGVALAQHLLAHGHRRIAWLSSVADVHHSVAARRGGVCAGLAAAGVQPQIFQAKGSTLQVPQRQELIASLLDQRDRPTAVIAYGGMDAGTLHVAAARRGLDIPTDLSVATFGNHVASDTGVAWCTAVIPWHTIGRQAVELLLEPENHGHRRMVPLAIKPGGSVAEVPSSMVSFLNVSSPTTRDRL